MLKYHEFRGKLGMGDLHPGGAPATGTLLRLLAEQGARRVLEVGAGIGNTAERMAALGWDVTALEPDPVLFAALERRIGSHARCEALLSHRAHTPYDAVVAESVFCMLDLPRTLAHARALLRPCGVLAFIEAVWTETVSAAEARAWHDRTLQLFGIPVGSRERLTWQDWSRCLAECGFETLHSQRLPRGSAGHPATPNLRASAAAVLRDPRLAWWMARYRARKRRAKMRSGVLESWIFLGKRSQEVPS